MSLPGAWLRLAMIGLNLIVLMAATLWILQFVFPPNYEISRESVRLRNSLIADVAPLAAFNWTPHNIPDDFHWEDDIPDEFRSISENLLGSVAPSEFERALALAGHLKTGQPHDTPISSNTRDTYRQIVISGIGWCSDFTQVINALALSASIPVREWGMSFDGFGGDGHAFNEIYDSALGKWVFLDAYFSFYVRDRRTGTPLSAIEFRDFLREGRPLDEVEYMQITPRFDFTSPAKVTEYYSQGADQFFLYWGNDVFSYDAHPLLKLLDGLPPAIVQASAIAVGAHPRLRIIATDTNEPWVARLNQQRNLFWVVIVITLACALMFAWQTSSWRRALRRVPPQKLRLLRDAGPS